MTSKATSAQTWTCPITIDNSQQIKLAHGSGGRAAQQLLENTILKIFADEELHRAHDGAYFEVHDQRELVLTTDSYVVQPLFFPGGNIGKLAVCGTANDLAMCGAAPRLLSVGLIIEEGFSLPLLEEVLSSMQTIAAALGMRVVTGDTKVVPRGQADGLFISTSGIGWAYAPQQLAPSQIAPGDVIILSGDVGRHGATITNLRHNLGFEGDLHSDCVPLWPMVEALFGQSIFPKCLRDITRGGLAAVLNELATSAGLKFCVNEQQIAIHPAVAKICQVLGFDPLHLACEGRLVACVAPEVASACLTCLQGINADSNPAIIGEVSSGSPGLVELEGIYGSKRILGWPQGELTPRIC